MSKLKLTCYSVNPDFKLNYHHEGDAGLDLPIWDDKLTNGELSTGGQVTLQPGQAIMLKTGIHLAIPEGHYGLLDSRSGTSKLRLDLLCRTIDSTYRGDIRVSFVNHNEEPVTIKNGDELFQIVIVPYDTAETEHASSLEEFMSLAGSTKRGGDGFGSKERKNGEMKL